MTAAGRESLPVCLDAMFRALNPEQAAELANTITLELASAAHRYQRNPNNQKGT
ncbi:MAG: hypothetical protein NVSMB4_18120 [Acidimicrobiales bacterium]